MAAHRQWGFAGTLAFILLFCAVSRIPGRYTLVGNLVPSKNGAYGSTRGQILQRWRVPVWRTYPSGTRYGIRHGSQQLKIQAGRRRRNDPPPVGNKNKMRSWTELTFDELGWIEVQHYPHGAKLITRRDDITDELPPIPKPVEKAKRGYELKPLLGVGREGNMDGIGTTSAFLTLPTDVAVGEDGNIYFAEPKKFRIRKVSRSLEVSNLAGLADVPGYHDGQGSDARFCIPNGIAVDVFGNVYVADTYNQRIRKIDYFGEVTTIAGTGKIGGQDGAALEATFNGPSKMVVVEGEIGSKDSLIITEVDGHKIRSLDLSSQIVTTLAGDGVFGYRDGIGTRARFTTPYALAADKHGNLYIGNSNVMADGRIRKISIDREVTSFVGQKWGFNDGKGTNVKFRGCLGMAVDTSGYLWISDAHNHMLRRVSPSGEVLSPIGKTLWPGRSEDMANFPQGLAAYEANSLILADSLNNILRLVSPTSPLPPTPQLKHPPPPGPPPPLPTPSPTPSPTEDEKAELNEEKDSVNTPARSSPFHHFLDDIHMQEIVLEEHPKATKMEVRAILSEMWQRMSPGERREYCRKANI
ncbi:hypothetical protein AAMO2058_000522500 [Amorphochlora amoebiformis]